MFANPANRCCIRTHLDSAKRYRTKMSPQNRIVALVQSQDHVINSANPGGTLNDGVQHRLHVCR